MKEDDDSVISREIEALEKRIKCLVKLIIDHNLYLKGDDEEEAASKTKAQVRIKQVREFINNYKKDSTADNFLLFLDDTVSKSIKSATTTVRVRHFLRSTFVNGNTTFLDNVDVIKGETSGKYKLRNKKATYQEGGYFCSSTDIETFKSNMFITDDFAFLGQKIKASVLGKAMQPFEDLNSYAARLRDACL